jgi:hypothetical protein
VDAHRQGSGPLAVQINHEHLLATPDEAGGYICGRGGFSNAALIIDDRDRLNHGVPEAGEKGKRHGGQALQDAQHAHGGPPGIRRYNHHTNAQKPVQQHSRQGERHAEERLSTVRAYTIITISSGYLSTPNPITAHKSTICRRVATFEFIAIYDVTIACSIYTVEKRHASLSLLVIS